jgi:hypothetical protein
MERGLQRDTFPRVKYPPYQFRLWEAVHSNGNGCDYISEHLLAGARCKSGLLDINGRTYGTLIVMEAKSVEPETAHAMERFAAVGGRVIFYPSRASAVARVPQFGRE